MQNNKFIIFISACIVSLGLIVLGLSNRFYIDTATKLKVDRLTGKTYKLSNDTWVKINDNKNTVELKNEKIDSVESLDNSAVEFDIVFPDIPNETGNSKYASERRSIILGRSIKVIIKNVSKRYIINNIALEVKLYKEDVLFYNVTIKKESLRIYPLSSVTEEFYLDDDVKYPDRPWEYSVSAKEIKGLPME